MATEQPPAVIYRGVLRLLKNDASSYQKYPFDSELLKLSRTLLRPKCRRKRSSSSSSEATATTIPVQNLEELISTKEFSIFFFYHPEQPHSLHLRSVLAEFCDKYSDKLFCVAFFGGESEDFEAQTLFVQGTGWLQLQLQLREDDENGTKTLSNLLSLLDITQIPSIVVVPNATGRPIVGQDLAVAWNAATESSAVAMMERWREGCSGLTLSQTLLAKTLGDSSSVCNIM